ncbi:hypothetical protein [Oryzomonas rubra]|uniref:Uncharacterized protein n=1 Tax=Oryzomonas rubra TaxID=2509454 RepID=A0A5A9X6B3_9BACT|nr:hypothetical protein [Oryzomonas rubra]KAA0888712.1 hypothetical protein ET418_15135 [Oryzomonas rubra]
MYDDLKMDAPINSRQLASVEIREFGAKLADRANSLAEKVETRLRPITTPPSPNPGKSSPGEDSKYPPLFQELNGILESISDSLDAIDGTIYRVEL